MEEKTWISNLYFITAVTVTIHCRGGVKTKTAYPFVILSMAKNLNTSIMCLQINPC